MSGPMRLLETGLLPAQHNVAITAAMAELHGEGRSPDTLRLCRYRPSVLVGRNQAIADVVRAKVCQRRNVDVVQRVTDGGAFYVNPGMLVWELVAERSRFGDHFYRIAEGICSGIAAGLARFGLPARYRPPCDVTIAGRRIAHSAGTLFGPTAVFQGTILIDVDRSELAAFIRNKPRHGALTPNPASDVSTLSDWLGRVPPVDELKALLVAALSFCWDREIRPGALTSQELDLIDRLGRQGSVGIPATGDEPFQTMREREAHPT